MQSDCLKIADLKDMLNKTNKIYGSNIAYKIRKEPNSVYKNFNFEENGIKNIKTEVTQKNDNEKYIIFTHKEVRDMINGLGTILIDMGLKNKRIAVIGENRYEWEIAYLSVVCGTGIVVPLDKALPENELKNLVAESQVEAIFCSEKYVSILEKIKYAGVGKLKHIISMDLTKNTNGIYSQKQLIEEGKKLVNSGNNEFINAEINAKNMSVMLFTSGTTSKPKIVALSHENICTNLMDLGTVLDINSNDILLSILPLHHVFECTVGFLLSMYKGSQTVFCDGVRHLAENLKEYHVSVLACVPAVYERIYKVVRKELEAEGKLEEVLLNEDKYIRLMREGKLSFDSTSSGIETWKNNGKASTYNKEVLIQKQKQDFKALHELLGGNIRLFISGAAPLDRQIEEKFNVLGLNTVQAYGLTETSPVIGIGTNEHYKLGTVGKALPSVEAKILNPNEEGVGELAVKGKSIMLGYYQNEEANKEAFVDGWFCTGDLAKIDSEGYITICGRKKSVIVLKNGKNIYPEEMENLLNRIEGVKESFIFGKQKQEDDVDDVKITAKIVFDREIVKSVYGAETEEEIYEAISNNVKEINTMMPKYKAIRGITLTEVPLIRTTTNKIKRNENM